jgi:hypothetical protein
MAWCFARDVKNRKRFRTIICYECIVLMHLLFNMRVAGLMLLIKIAYLGILSVALVEWGSYSDFNGVQVRWPREGPATFQSHFAAWDGAHYLLLESDGYSRGLLSCAFYPLWPMIIGAGTSFGLPSFWTSFVLTNLFSALAWSIFYHNAARVVGRGGAFWATVLLIVWPGGLFYQFPYSESLFLLCLVVFMNSLAYGHFISALAASILLPLCRGPGLFTLLPIAWSIATRMELNGLSRTVPRIVNILSRFRQESLDTLVVPLDRKWLAVLAGPVIGWIIYLLLMWFWTGNPLEGVYAQRYWGRHSISHLFNIPHFIHEFFAPTDIHSFAGSLLDRILFIPVIFSIWPLWCRNREWAVWAYVLGVLPAMSGSFTSFTRFSAVLIPCFWLWGEYLSRPRSRFKRLMVLLSSIGLHFTLVWRFCNFQWAG